MCCSCEISDGEQRSISVEPQGLGGDDDDDDDDDDDEDDDDVG